MRIRPVILAGGLGTRMRPRTEHIPKPMLPVSGRPILWYVLRNASCCDLLPPIVTLDYKADVISSFFDGHRGDFRVLPNRTMAEAFLAAAESDDADAFLGMSSDVLFPVAGVDMVVSMFQTQQMDTALFARLPTLGHKKWCFDVENDRLRDIRVADSQVAFERLLLILKRDSIKKLREELGSPVERESLAEKWHGYQTGWTLLLKCLARSEVPIFSRIVDVPVHNINVPDDLAAAEAFVARNLGGVD